MIGVYAFCFGVQSGGVRPTYIGMSSDIGKRILQHKGREYFCDKLIYQCVDSVEEAKRLEQYLITRHGPTYNNRKYRRPPMFEANSIDDVFNEREHRPWRHVSLIDSIEIKRLKGEYND